MTDFVERFIVQDLDSFEFLCPETNGDIGQTPYLKSAGRYETREDAFQGGIEETSGQFTVVSLYEKSNGKTN